MLDLLFHQHGFQHKPSQISTCLESGSYGSGLFIWYQDGAGIGYMHQYCVSQGSLIYEQGICQGGDYKAYQAIGNTAYGAGCNHVSSLDPWITMAWVIHDMWSAWQHIWPSSESNGLSPSPLWAEVSPISLCKAYGPLSSDKVRAFGRNSK